MRTRDYCTTPADILGMCLHVITTSLATASWANVHNYAAKAEGVPDVSVSPAGMSITGAVHGQNLRVSCRHACRAGSLVLCWTWYEQPFGQLREHGLEVSSVQWG